VPTGVHLRDAREQLLDAAERVLRRDGPAALTSRAVTAEAGCAKGVLHRHFADFDALLVQLVNDRVGRVHEQAASLVAAAGTGTVDDHLTTALTDLFDPIAVSIVAIVILRDDLRERLRLAGSSPGIPILSEAAGMFADYLADERSMGRIAADADVDSLALALIGSGHLLFADRDAEPPSGAQVEAVVASVIADALQRRLL
jgi:AcrR family transcriptional regulator